MDLFTLTKAIGYRPTPAARQAVINRMANVSDGYTTKMLSTFNFGNLGYIFGKYIVPGQIGPPFATYAASRGGVSPTNPNMGEKLLCVTCSFVCVTIF